MDILILPSWYTTVSNPLSGIFFKEQAEALAIHKDIHSVTVLSVEFVGIKTIFKTRKCQLGFRYELINGVHTYSLRLFYIPKLKKLNELIKTMLTKLYLKKVLKRRTVSIVHLHSFMHGKFALWLKEKFDLPFVYTEHSSLILRDMLSQENKNEIEVTSNQAAYNLAVSKNLMQLLNSDFQLKKSFEYLPNFVNFSLFSGVKVLHSEFTFVNVAFLNKNKQHLMLIKAFSQLLQDFPNCKLNIIGDGVEFTTLDSYIKLHKLGKNITLLGQLNRHEVNKQLSHSDVFVLSSAFETFGVSIIEAMAFGLPIVSTKSGGPESIVRNSNLGRLCGNDELSLYTAMKEVLLNYEMYKSDYIKEFAESHFSKEFVTNKLIEIYKGNQ